MSATDEPKGASGAGFDSSSEPANKKPFTGKDLFNGAITPDKLPPTVETEKGRILANLLNTIGEQAQEIERLKRGDFTAEEFQNLCHNKTVQDGFGDFVVGCHLYQQQLFGISADEVITEVERLKDAVVDAAVEWHESGREGASHEWFANADKLSNALDELISFRNIGKPKGPVTVKCDGPCQTVTTEYAPVDRCHTPLNVNESCSGTYRNLPGEENGG